MEFFTHFKLRSSHCGPGGQLQLARYFEIINRSVEDWFAGPVGLSFTDMHRGEQRLGIPTVKIMLDIQQAAALGEELQTSLQVIELRRSAIELEIVALCDNQARFSVRVTLIMANAVDGRLQSMAIPAPLKHAMLEYFALSPGSADNMAPNVGPSTQEAGGAVPERTLYECDRPVFFQDCDPAQIVFYPRYLEMVDDLIYDWSRSVEIKSYQLLAVNVEFWRPSQLGDELQFTLKLQAVTNTEIQLSVSAKCQDESRLGALLRLSLPKGHYHPL